MRNLILLIILSLQISCIAPRTPRPSDVTPFDPTAGGTGGATSGRSPAVIRLTSSINANNDVTLSWSNPGVYTSTDFNVYVYRVSGDGSAFSLPDPDTPYSNAYIYQLPGYTIGQNTTATDASGLISNTYYTYYVYVNVNNAFSMEAKITILTRPITPTLNLPNPAAFWSNVSSTSGQKPIGGNLFVNTMSPGIPTNTKPTGGMAFLETGGLLYYLDTANNRVLVASSETYNSCKGFTVGTDDWNTCQEIYRGYPLFFTAVIGQKDFYSSYPCGDPANTLNQSQCLTTPSGIMVADGKLFIADSGNNRIVIHSSLPTYGCYHIDNLLGTPTPNECTPYKIVGKKTLSDSTTYSVATDGNSSLNFPTGMAYKNDTLYIADTHNNRVVGVYNITDNDLYNCTSSNWQNSLCSWSFVLGQADMFSNEKFSDLYNNGITYSLAGHSLSDPDYLSRHFANPTQIFTIDDKLLIGANEDFSAIQTLVNIELYSRLLVFDTNPFLDNVSACNSSTFLTSVCAANYSIGQESFGKLVESGTGENYMDKNYAIKRATYTPFSSTGLIAVENTTNSIMIWNNYANTSLFDGIPYNTIVTDPAGSTYRGILLPDLLSLNNVYYTSADGTLFVEDALLGKVFQIPLTSF